MICFNMLQEYPVIYTSVICTLAYYSNYINPDLLPAEIVVGLAQTNRDVCTPHTARSTDPYLLVPFMPNLEPQTLQNGQWRVMTARISCTPSTPKLYNPTDLLQHRCGKFC